MLEYCVSIRKYTKLTMCKTSNIPKIIAGKSKATNKKLIFLVVELTNMFAKHVLIDKEKSKSLYETIIIEPKLVNNFLHINLQKT